MPELYPTAGQSLPAGCNHPHHPPAVGIAASAAGRRSGSAGAPSAGSHSCRRIRSAASPAPLSAAPLPVPLPPLPRYAGQIAAAAHRSSAPSRMIAVVLFCILSLGSFSAFPESSDPAAVCRLTSIPICHSNDALRARAQSIQEFFQNARTFSMLPCHTKFV